MRLREKGKTEIITLGWDEAQAALRAGTHEVASDEGAGGNDAEPAVGTNAEVKTGTKSAESTDAIESRRDGKRS